MKEKELKTSVGQRVAISIIAFFMLGSVIASYAAIIVGNSNNQSNASETQKLSEERMAYYQDNYASKLAKFKETTKEDFEKFAPYLSEVKGFNETAANESTTVQIRDLLVGDGRTLGANADDYLAYYVGWCADESVFESSLDTDKLSSATGFATMLDPGLIKELYGSSLIEGWYMGMDGARIGGIREITIPSSLAYKDQKEICGGYNKPIRYMIMAKENDQPLKFVLSELNTATIMLQYANYGIDYEKEAAVQQPTGE
ncbi:FKBP-type peptidyl-prolyl cis-trans isomerase [Candidatus Saccharibacteria bacterium]|nr:FKBP-type peptidyl-prolyl cis-trans isomerase [Candidatus Saccharibacteria bacterium]